ncbi:hypothetical protein P43SY_006657 [Pythium insidiosum]|uniref:Uncharacterized protein n=1 Tax=Pythium insidiosum TaxID=114742 RepID=A0AAD5Q7W5_PYTIN|nr:hypothetical protein P43SY_006657 [Pythium insidiosum]
MEIPVTTTRETSDVRAPSHLKRLVAGGLLVAGSAALALGLYGHHSPTFHADTTRLLQEIASAKGLQVTLAARANASDTPAHVHGILFPRAAADGQLEFDGRVSYDYLGVQYNFTLLDRRAYVTEEQIETGKLTRLDCLHPGNIPPVSLLADSLKSARVIDALANPEFSGVACPSGQLLEFHFVGEPYVLCAQPGSGSAAVHGADIKASIELLRENSEGVPSLASLAPPSGLALSKCNAIPAADTTLSRRNRRLQDTLAHVSQRTADVLQVATGGRRLGLLGAEPECSCTRGRKQCLFVHGLGYEAGETSDSFEYFGKIHEQVKCCETVKFVRLDTINNNWFADELTTKVCDAAVAITNGKDRQQLRNLALITHSMGNLITAAAILNNKCALAADSMWISLAGPMKGSMTATTAVSAMDKLSPDTKNRWCTNDPNTVLDDPIYNVLNGLGLCTSLISTRSMAYQYSKVATPEVNAMYDRVGEIYRKHVSSSMCGTNPIGLVSASSAKLVAEAALSGHKSLENDGEVDFPSCHATVDASRYQKSWSGGRFYKASLNHLDIAFRNGDGWWGQDRKPIKWLNCQF